MHRSHISYELTSQSYKLWYDTTSLWKEIDSGYEFRIVPPNEWVDMTI